VQVIAQFDAMSDSVTRCYAITRGGDLAGDVVRGLPETNTSDPVNC
jgi:hypothetical protein